MKKEYSNLEDKINNKNKISQNNDSMFIELYRRIDELKEKLSRYPFELNKDEKIISINFISRDGKLHYSVFCKNTEKFNRLEEKLYDDYPEYSESDNYFVSNGNIIKKFKTLKENNIHHNDIIMINQNNN